MNGVFHALLSAAKAVLPLSAHDLLAQLAATPGLGVLTLLTLMLLTGMFVANFVGQWWLKQWDRILSNIPIVKSIYSSVKQVSDTLFSSSGQAFREAVLVEYPRRDCWTIAFVTGKPGGEVIQKLQQGSGSDSEFVSLYVPTTPNPTSGFFLMAPRADVRPLAMSVDEALKYIISMGVVAPAAGQVVAPAASAAAARH
jgi:uncharacterized membrane protein